MQRPTVAIGLAIALALAGCGASNLAPPAPLTASSQAAALSVAGWDSNAELSDAELVDASLDLAQAGGFKLPAVSPGTMHADGLFAWIGLARGAFRTVGLITSGPIGWFILARQVYTACRKNGVWASPSPTDGALHKVLLSNNSETDGQLASLEGKLVLVKGNFVHGKLVATSFDEAKRSLAAHHIPCTPQSPASAKP